jgi:primosomal replication protein N
MPGEILRKIGQSYITENIRLEYHSSLTNAEAEKLIGKQIKKVESGEDRLVLTFSDGSRLLINGFTINEESGRKDSLDISLEERIIKLNI